MLCWFISKIVIFLSVCLEEMSRDILHADERERERKRTEQENNLILINCSICPTERLIIFACKFLQECDYKLRHGNKNISIDKQT